MSDTSRCERAGVGAQKAKRFFAVGGFDDPVAASLQRNQRQLPDRVVVFNQEDGLVASRRRGGRF